MGVGMGVGVGVGMGAAVVVGMGVGAAVVVATGTGADVVGAAVADAVVVGSGPPDAPKPVVGGFVHCWLGIDVPLGLYDGWPACAAGHPCGSLTSFLMYRSINTPSCTAPVPADTHAT